MWRQCNFCFIKNHLHWSKEAHIFWCNSEIYCSHSFSPFHSQPTSIGALSTNNFNRSTFNLQFQSVHFQQSISIIPLSTNNFNRSTFNQQFQSFHFQPTISIVPLSTNNFNHSTFNQVKPLHQNTPYSGPTIAPAQTQMHGEVGFIQWFFV